MIKIEDGNVVGSHVFGENIGKKISINRYTRPDSKVDGFRFGTIESLCKSKNGIISLCHTMKIVIMEKKRLVLIV